MRARTLNFKTQSDGFTDAVGDLVQGPPLRMASGKLRHRSDVEALFISFNNNVELALHARWPPIPILVPLPHPTARYNLPLHTRCETI